MAFLFMACSSFAIDPEEHMQFADGLYARKLYEMAIREYLVLSKEAPRYENIDVALFRLAESYRRMGKKTDSVRFHERLIKEHPQSAFRFKAHLRRAEMYASEGKYEGAIPFFQTLLELTPPPEIAVSAHYYLGFSLKKTDQAKDAEKAFRRVVDEYVDSPFMSFACIELADMYRQQKRRKKDIQTLYQKAADNPATDRVGAEALFQLGEWASKHKKYEQSIQAYEQLISTYPKSPRVKEFERHVVWSYYYIGRYQEALALIGNVLTRSENPDQAEWLYIKANCERKSGKNKEALATYDQLITGFPASPFVMGAGYEKALIAFTDNDFRAVIEQLEKMDPTDPIKKDAYWLLA